MYGRKMFEEYMQVLDDASLWMRSAKCYKHSAVQGQSSGRSRKAASAAATGPESGGYQNKVWCLVCLKIRMPLRP